MDTRTETAWTTPADRSSAASAHAAVGEAVTRDRAADAPYPDEPLVGSVMAPGAPVLHASRATFARPTFARPTVIDLHPALMGLATGLRSQIGMAALAVSSRARGTTPAAPLAVLGSDNAARFASAALAAELLVDKLPFARSRLALPSLVLRCGLAAVAGKAVAERDGVPVGPAVGEAVASALGGAVLGRAARGLVSRGRTTRKLRMAFAEDAVATGLAAVAVGGVQMQIMRQF